IGAGLSGDSHRHKSVDHGCREVSSMASMFRGLQGNYHARSTRTTAFLACDARSLWSYDLLSTRAGLFPDLELPSELQDNRAIPTIGPTVRPQDLLATPP